MVGAPPAGVVDALDSTPNCELALWRACRVLFCSELAWLLLDPLAFCRLVVCEVLARLDSWLGVDAVEVAGGRFGPCPVGTTRFSTDGFGLVLWSMRSTPATPGPITPVAVHAARAVAQTPAAALLAGLPIPIAVSPPPDERSLVANSRVRSATATAPDRIVSIVPPMLLVAQAKRLSETVRLSHAASPTSNSGTVTPRRSRRLSIAASRLLLKVGSLQPSASAPSRVDLSSK